MKIVAKGALRERRLKSGLSLESLAKEAGISYTTICHIENGYSAYPVTTRKVCRALDCQFDDIFLLKDA